MVALGIVASRNGRSRNGRVRNGRSRIGRSRIGTSTPGSNSCTLLFCHNFYFGAHAQSGVLESCARLKLQITCRLGCGERSCCEEDKQTFLSLGILKYIQGQSKILYWPCF
jgi:hypothetical protein